MIGSEPPTMHGYTAATYGESFADVYDDWYADVTDGPSTVAGLSRLAGAGPVLELGVGTGRLALPLAAAGIRVVGVDASPAMLERLAAKPGAAAVTAIEADMASVGDIAEVVDAGPYRLVFAAFNTFFNLVSDDAQQACLRGIASLLHPDGLLVIEGFVPPPEGLTDGGVSVRDVTPDAVVLTASVHDAAAQLIRGHHVELRADGNRLRPWIVHYRTISQLDASAAAAGFVVVDRWADWSGTPFLPPGTPSSPTDPPRIDIPSSNGPSPTGGAPSDTHITVYGRGAPRPGRGG